MTLAHTDLRYLTYQVLLSSKVSQATATVHLVAVKSVLELSAHFTSRSESCVQQREKHRRLLVTGWCERAGEEVHVFHKRMPVGVKTPSGSLEVCFVKLSFPFGVGRRPLSIGYVLGYVSLLSALGRFQRIVPPNSYPKSPQGLQVQIAGSPGSDHLWASNRSLGTPADSCTLTLS